MDGQLFSYIKQALAQQKSHDDIVRELLDVGWKKEDIDIAFGNVQDFAHSAPPASLAVPSAAEQPVSTPVMPNTTFATPDTAVANGEGTSTSSNGGTLPGVFALLKGGFAIYKARFGVLVGMGVILPLIFLFSYLLMFIGGEMLSASGTSFAHSLVLVLVVIAILPLSVGVIWLEYWITLASMQAIRGYKEKTSFKEAFGNTRHLAWSFLWFSLVVVLVSVGGIFLISILPSALLALLGFLSPIALIIPGIYLVISLAVLASLFGTWFVFSGWTFLTESQRGIHALTTSRELVRGRFWKVLGRVFGVFFIISIGIALFNLVLMPIMAIVPMVAGTVSGLVNDLFFIPLSLAVVYFLYEQVRLQVPNIPTSAPRVRKTFIAYAIIGPIGIIITFLAVSAIILGSLNIERQKGNDAVIQADLSTILTQSALDYPGDNNSYGSMTSIAKVPATPLAWTGEAGSTGVSLLSSSVSATNVDSTVAQALGNAYTNANGHDVYYFANKSSFFVAAKLNVGVQYFCVDSNGYAGQVTNVPFAGGSCKK